jgi:tripeptidyl-peptidase-1
MHFSHLLSGAAIAIVALALPQKEWTYETFEELARPPRGWSQMEQEVRPSHMLELEFHLSPPNGDAFEQHVIDISTPGHAAYGNHMDRDQISMMLQPSDDAITSIFSWLSATGYGDKMQAEDDWVKLHISVAEAEKLLQTKYHYFKSDDDGTVLLRTLSVQLPKEVLPHVDFVQPTTAMLKMTPQRSWLSDKFEMYGPPPADGICNGSAITPSCVNKVYHLDSYKPKGLASVGVSGYLEEYAQKADLEQFLQTFVPEFAGTSFPVVSINGGLNLQATDGNANLSVGEANLDIQWTTGLNTPIVNTYYTTAGRAPIDPTVDNPAPSTNEPYTEQLKYLLSLEKLPDVLTTSYGEPEISVPLSFRLQVCKLFAQLGARGVSVIFSSGDLGPGAACLSNDGKNTTTFEPIFPAACVCLSSSPFRLIHAEVINDKNCVAVSRESRPYISAAAARTAKQYICH